MRRPVDERSAALPGDHPGRARLCAFGSCRLGRRESRAVVRHLLGGCRPCAERLRAELAPQASSTELASGAAAGSPAAAPGAAALGRLTARIAELASLDAAAQCRSLLAAARELGDGDPRLTGMLCSFGLAIAEAADAGATGTPIRGGEGARLWAELGNARRLAGDIEGAESAFAAAHGLITRITRIAAGADRGPEREPAVGSAAAAAGCVYAEILELHGRLRHDQGRFAEAADLFGWAQGLFEREAPGGTAAAGRAGMARGIALGAAGEPASGAACLLAGLERADLSAGGRIEGFLQLALLTVAGGRPALGRALARFARRREPSGLSPAEALRCRFLEGELAASLGEYLPASRALREARAGLEALGRPHDALQAALALAALELDQGRPTEAERLVSEALGGAGPLRLAEAGREALESLASSLGRRRAGAAAVRATAIRVKAAGTRGRGPSSG